MTPKLNAVRLAKAAARKVLHALEDVTSVRPGKTGPVRWIDAEQSGWSPARASSAPSSDQDMVGWRQREPMRCIGVCQVEMPDVYMLKSHPHQGRNPLDRRAAVRVHSFRRVAYPRAPYLATQRLRAILQYEHRFPRRGPHLHERIALLGNHARDACNYYHFWIDTVGDYLMLQDTLPSDLQPDRFLISHGLQPWQDEVLELVGIPSDRVVRYHDHDRFTAEQLLVPVRDKGALNMTPGLVERIRKSVGMLPFESGSSNSLYISRGDSLRRPIQNESDVQSLVEAYGMDVRQLSGMSVREQISLFARAGIVVAAHGAGLTNLMWCQEGTIVVELMPDRHRIPCFRNICQQRNLQHHVILCPQPGSEWAGAAQMHVPLERLSEILRMVHYDRSSSMI